MVSSPLPFGVHRVPVRAGFRSNRKPLRVSIAFRRSPRSGLGVPVGEPYWRPSLHCLSAFTAFRSDNSPEPTMVAAAVSIAFRRSPRSGRAGVL